MKGQQQMIKTCFLLCLSSTIVTAFMPSTRTTAPASSLIQTTRIYSSNPEQQQPQEDEIPVSDQVLGSLLTKLASPAAAAAESTETTNTDDDLSATISSISSPTTPKKKDNNAMAFLRKIGKVGGNKDFTNAIGSDEGAGMADTAATTATNAGGASSLLKKAKAAYQECTVTGIMDDMTQIFPLTSSGTAWRGVSDSVQGGFSNGLLKREAVDEKPANVLEGTVLSSSSDDDDDSSPGFLKMVADLSMDNGGNGVVDASQYDGIEIDVQSKEGFEFSVHLRNPNSSRSSKSYRHVVQLEVTHAWETVRIPFSSFQAENDDDDSTVDPSDLQRIGIVTTTKEDEMNVYLAIGGVRFYNVI